jgi:hypothetical protein
MQQKTDSQFENVVGVYVENSNSNLKEIKKLQKNPEYQEIKDLSKELLKTNTPDKNLLKSKLISSIKSFLKQTHIGEKTLLQTLSLENNLFETEELILNNKQFNIVKFICMQI